MKKTILIVLMLFIFASVASASSNGYLDGHPIVKIVVNGQELVPDGTPAMIYNSYTLVPIGTLRQLGFTVTWNQETYTVTITPPDPVIIEVMVDSEGVPIGTTDTGAPPLDAEGATTTPVPATPDPNATPSPTPAPDNTAQCEEIRHDYAYQIAAVEYTPGSQGQHMQAVLILEYERDQELAAAGCN